MKSFEKIRHKIGCEILKYKLKSFKREIRFHNLGTAKTINLIFDASSEANLKQAKLFIDFLTKKNKKVNALGFVEKKEDISNYIYRKGIDFFSINNVNWYGKPQNPTVTEFINTNPDILINLSLSHNFTLDYIMALSKAKFKISESTKKHISDFSIDISKNNSVKYLTDQIIHYLEMIEAK